MPKAAARGKISTFFQPGADLAARPSCAVPGSPSGDAQRADAPRIISLTIDEVCELHAAREFYSNALQGNLDFTPDEVLRSLRARFAPWFVRFSNHHRASSSPAPPAAKPAPPQPGPRQANGHHSVLTPAQLDVVVSHMKERRLVDVEEVLQRLGGGAFKDALLKEVENHPNLKAHAGPRSIVLQWRV